MAVILRTWAFEAYLSFQQYARRGRTPRFSGRPTTASCGKLSMRDPLIPVRCKRLFGGAFIRNYLLPKPLSDFP
jgi:hypothetical protein